VKTIQIQCQGARNVDYKKLKPFQGRLKKLTDENKQKLKSEILENGFTAPIFIWENSLGILYTMDGHQRCKVLAELEKDGYKIPEIPVAIIHAPDEQTAKRRLLGIVSQYGQLTEAGLLGYIEAAKLDPKKLTNFSFPDIDLNGIIDQLAAATANEPGNADETPPLPTKPKTKRGQIFILGDHGVMCGDSTEWKDVAKLMDGEKARMIFTDPPYGVSYSGVAGNESEVIKNDDLRMHFENALETAGFKVKQQLIWNKGMILSRSDYHWAHEPIFYAMKHGRNCDWYGDRTGKTILAMHWPDIEKLKKEELQEMVKAMINNTTNWEYKRESVLAYMHPTQKPVSLCGVALRNSTRPGDLVIDIFGGSGSTLMACELMNRRCFTMELDEKFCDVIISRWEKHTGKKSEREK
jgi:DNA modification methylase